jgi:hypothetical protein
MGSVLVSHTRQAGEFYAVLFILGLYGTCFVLGSLGAIQWRSGHRLRGACLLVAGFSCGVVATILGGANS